MNRPYCTTQRSGHIRLPMVAAVAVPVLLLGIGMSLWIGGTSKVYLPTEAYYDAPRSFAGNHYSFDVRIEAQLDYIAGSGRLLQVRTLQNDAPLIVYCPEAVGGFMPHPGQVYRIDTAVDSDGMLQLKTFKKL